MLYGYVVNLLLPDDSDVGICAILVEGVIHHSSLFAAPQNPSPYEVLEPSGSTVVLRLALAEVLVGLVCPAQDIPLNEQ